MPFENLHITQAHYKTKLKKSGNTFIPLLKPQSPLLHTLRNIRPRLRHARCAAHILHHYTIAYALLNSTDENRRRLLADVIEQQGASPDGSDRVCDGELP